jgi:hypothetical protein
MKISIHKDSNKMKDERKLNVKQLKNSCKEKKKEKAKQIKIQSKEIILKTCKWSIQKNRF